MNNSKKRVSKVVAVAMASAMAMSSLSAALVVANAATDTAITMQNQTGTATSVSGGSNINLYFVEGGDGGYYQLPLAEDFTLTYTTPDGAEIDVPGTDIRWSVKSGSAAQLRNNNAGNPSVRARDGQAGDTVLTATVYSKIKPDGTRSNNEVAISASKNITVTINRDIAQEGQMIMATDWDTISRYNGTTTVGYQSATSTTDSENYASSTTSPAYTLDWATVFPSDADTLVVTSTNVADFGGTDSTTSPTITLAANEDGTGNVVVASRKGVDGRNVKSVNVRVEASYTVPAGAQEIASGDIFGSSTVIGDKNINVSSQAGNKVIVEDGATLTVTGSVRDVVLRGSATLLVDGGTVTNVDTADATSDATIQVINGGKITSALDAGGADVVVNGGTVGNVTGATNITVENGMDANVLGSQYDSGTSTTGSLEASGSITINGGNVNGNVFSNGLITIGGTGRDENSDGIATKITGNVTSVGNYLGLEAGVDDVDAQNVKTGTVGTTPGKVVINHGEDSAQTVTVTGTVKALNTGTITDGSGIVVNANTPDYFGTVSLNTVQADNIAVNANGANVSVKNLTASTEKAWGDNETVEDQKLDLNGFVGTTSIGAFNYVDIDDKSRVTVNGTITAGDMTLEGLLKCNALNLSTLRGTTGYLYAPAGSVRVNTLESNGTIRFYPSGTTTVGSTLYVVGNGSASNTLNVDYAGLSAEKSGNSYRVSNVDFEGLVANQLAVQVTESGTATVTAANLPSAAALPSGMKVQWKLYVNNDSNDTPDTSSEAGLLQNAKITSNGTSATITGVDFSENDRNKDNILWAVASVVDSEGNDMGYQQAEVRVDVVQTASSSTDPTDPDQSNVKLDTQVVYMINEVSLYDFLVTGNNDTDNITVTSSDESVATVALQDAADTRGAKYRVTTHGTGEATITVGYNGETATMKVVVYPKGGSITLDTVNYKMAPGNIYDIGVTVTDGNGTALSGEQVQQMVANGELRVTDSRTGSIVDLTQLPNGNFRVTGKNAGTCYITYEVIQDGVAVTHASVKVDVAAGTTQGGVATRDTSWWADKSVDPTTQA